MALWNLELKCDTTNLESCTDRNMRNVKDSWYSIGRKALCLTAFSVCLTAGRAETDAKNYFDGNPWGWGVCADEAGTAYTLNGGMGATQPKTIVLTTNGADNSVAIRNAIAQYDIIVLDGSKGNFRINEQMAISNAKNKTIVGRNGATLSTQFYLTPSDIEYLKSQNLEGLSSTDQYTGTLPDGTTLTCDRRAFFTKKAMMELQFQKTGVYSLPNKAGIFQFDGTCENVIVRNLVLQGPGAVDIDGVDLIYDAYANHLWVDHCTFIDSQDGALDTRGNYNTYTWNHFYYTDRSYSHAYTCGLGWVSNHSTVLHVTWGYNLWGAGCQRRLPQADDAFLHLVNNYHNCPGNSVGMTLNAYTTALVEGNYAASGVKDPLTGSGEKRYILARNNNFSYTSTTQSVTLPYTYPTPISYVLVPQVLTAQHGAGATLDELYMPLGYNKLSAETFGFYESKFEALKGTTILLPIRNWAGVNYTLESSNTAVVTVDNATGKARAAGVGTAVIKAIVDDPQFGTYSAEATVVVNQPSAFETIRKWDFTSFSAETKSDLEADATLWSSDGSSYTNKSALSHAALTADGNVIAEAEGLKFTSVADKLVIYAGGRIRLNKEGSVIELPDLKKDDKVLVTWKSANSSAQRGFSITNLSVASMLTDGTQVTKQGLVLADGTVALSVSGGGIYVSTIEVQRQQGSSALENLHAENTLYSGLSYDLQGGKMSSQNRGLQLRQGHVVLVR